MSALHDAEGHVAGNNDMAEEHWSDDEFALQSMEGPAPKLDASDFVRAARLKADQAAPSLSPLRPAARLGTYSPAVRPVCDRLPTR